MGLFQQRPEDERQDWAGLPSEPRDTDVADALESAPYVDPLSVGLDAEVTSIVFAIAPPDDENEGLSAP